MDQKEFETTFYNYDKSANYYAVAYDRLMNKSKNTFNWAAFVNPPGWFTFKKMYRMAFMSSLVWLVAILAYLNLVIRMATSRLPNLNDVDNVTLFMESGGVYHLIIFGAAVLLMIPFMIYFGLKGNSFYFRHLEQQKNCVNNQSKIVDRWTPLVFTLLHYTIVLQFLYMGYKWVKQCKACKKS